MVDSKEKKIENGIVPYTIRGTEITFQSKADFIRAFDEFKSQRIAELLLNTSLNLNSSSVYRNSKTLISIHLEFTKKAYIGQYILGI